jgi:hypothetical protein
MNAIKFSYANQVDVETGDILARLTDHTINEPRVWNECDDHRFLNACRDVDWEEMLLIDLSNDQVFIVSAVEARLNKLLMWDQYPTEPVTAHDIKKGVIRVPMSHINDAKMVFPDDKATVTVVLRGNTIICEWDPRMDADKEWSGVLHIGQQLKEIVKVGEVLMVSSNTEPNYVIE